MFELARNIISFIGTFLIISSASMLVLKYIAYLFTGKCNHQETPIAVFIAGIIIALLLIPFYYLPC